MGWGCKEREKERETVTEALIPDPKGPCALRRGVAPGTTGHSPDRRAQAAGENRTDAHSERLGSTLCNSVQRIRPGQPSLERPGPAPPRPCQDHTPTRAPPPTPLHYKPRLVSDARYNPDYHTFLAGLGPQTRPRPYYCHLPNLNPSPDQIRARPATS